MPPHDETETTAIERVLESSRPVPRAAFRGELRRHLLARQGHAPPARLRYLIGAYAGSGTLLLVVAAAGLAGTGPLAA